MENQYTSLQQFCVASEIAADEWVKEIGGGLNFTRPKFLKIVDSIVLRPVEQLVIAHQDRLVRFGYELLDHLCQRHECKLIVMNVESLSPEQEMIQDMLAIVDCFSSRLYGTQGVPDNYRKELRKALENDTGTQDTSQSDA